MHNNSHLQFSIFSSTNQANHWWNLCRKLWEWCHNCLFCYASYCHV